MTTKPKMREDIKNALLAIPAGTATGMTAGELADAIVDRLGSTKPKKLGPVKVDYTREELIAICEAASVPMKHWHDRDSAGAQRQVGDCWALLRADVPFRIEAETDHKTIWIEHYGIKGFDYFEYGDNTGDHPSGYGMGDNKGTETSYLPTPARLEEAAGKDWY